MVHIGYYDLDAGRKKRNGKFGKLPNRKLNWPTDRLARHMKSKHYKGWVTWRTAERLKGNDHGW